MDKVRNPYVPGAGLKPSALVGRDNAINDWEVSLRRAERGVTDPPHILNGLRGVGKTVLLSEFRHRAESRDWMGVQVEAGNGRSLREMIGEALYEPLIEISRPSASRRILQALKTALSFKASYDAAGSWTFGIDLTESSGGGANSGSLELDLERIFRDISLAAREEERGLAVLIDEAQDLEPLELTSFAVAAQKAGREGWPVLIALAGLPSLPQKLAEAKSYSERFIFVPVERLTLTESREALSIPAQTEGVVWEPEALDRVVQDSGQYPYFIQQFGQEAWNVAEGTSIELSDAREGIAKGQNKLDNGFFRSRWDRTTPAEKHYLRAMSISGDRGITTGEVAEILGRNISSLTPIRGRLINKGLIFAPDHGIVMFTVPGMANFIDRQNDHQLND